MDSTADLFDVTELLAQFVLPMLVAIRENVEFRKQWLPNGPWR
jgi:hypothetical protein